MHSKIEEQFLLSLISCGIYSKSNFNCENIPQTITQFTTMLGILKKAQFCLSVKELMTKYKIKQFSFNCPSTPSSESTDVLECVYWIENVTFTKHKNSCDKNCHEYHKIVNNFCSAIDIALLSANSSEVESYLLKLSVINKNNIFSKLSLLLNGPEESMFNNLKTLYEKNNIDSHLPTLQAQNCPSIDTKEVFKV